MTASYNHCRCHLHSMQPLHTDCTDFSLFLQESMQCCSSVNMQNVGCLTLPVMSSCAVAAKADMYWRIARLCLGQQLASIGSSTLPTANPLQGQGLPTRLACHVDLQGLRLVKIGQGCRIVLLWFVTVLTMCVRSLSLVRRCSLRVACVAGSDVRGPVPCNILRTLQSTSPKTLQTIFCTETLPNLGQPTVA
jgi:hypothetical protein